MAFNSSYRGLQSSLIVCNTFHGLFLKTIYWFLVDCSSETKRGGGMNKSDYLKSNYGVGIYLTVIGLLIITLHNAKVLLNHHPIKINRCVLHVDTWWIHISLYYFIYLSVSSWQSGTWYKARSLRIMKEPYQTYLRVIQQFQNINLILFNPFLWLRGDGFQFDTLRNSTH